MTRLEADFTAVTQEQKDDFSSLNHALAAKTLIKHDFVKDLNVFLNKCGIANNADGSNPLVIAACSAPSPSIDVLAVLVRNDYSFKGAPLDIRGPIFKNFSAQYPVEAARARVHLPRRSSGGHGWGPAPQ